MKNLLLLISFILISMTVTASEGNPTSETKRSDANSKLSPGKRESTRTPANSAVDVADIGARNTVYKIVDTEEDVVCYVATGTATGNGAGYGNSIYCMKR